MNFAVTIRHRPTARFACWKCSCHFIFYIQLVMKSLKFVNCLDCPNTLRFHYILLVVVANYSIVQLCLKYNNNAVLICLSKIIILLYIFPETFQKVDCPKSRFLSIASILWQKLDLRKCFSLRYIIYTLSIYINLLCGLVCLKFAIDSKTTHTIAKLKPHFKLRFFLRFVLKNQNSIRRILRVKFHTFSARQNFKNRENFETNKKVS